MKRKDAGEEEGFKKPAPMPSKLGLDKLAQKVAREKAEASKLEKAYNEEDDWDDRDDGHGKKRSRDDADDVGSRKKLRSRRDDTPSHPGGVNYAAKERRDAERYGEKKSTYARKSFDSSERKGSRSSRDSESHIRGPRTPRSERGEPRSDRRGDSRSSGPRTPRNDDNSGPRTPRNDDNSGPRTPRNDDSVRRRSNVDRTPLPQTPSYQYNEWADRRSRRDRAGSRAPQSERRHVAGDEEDRRFDREYYQHDEEGAREEGDDPFFETEKAKQFEAQLKQRSVKRIDPKQSQLTNDMNKYVPSMMIHSNKPKGGKKISFLLVVL